MFPLQVVAIVLMNPLPGVKDCLPKILDQLTTDNFSKPPKTPVLSRKQRKLQSDQAKQPEPKTLVTETENVNSQVGLEVPLSDQQQLPTNPFFFF